MRPNSLRLRLAAGDIAVSGWVSMGHPYLAELLSHAGYDAVTIDLQHGMFGLDTAVGLIQAVGAGPATPMARCPSLDAATIGKLLDAGAYGIVCPAVDSADAAAEFVRACRYPPDGARSYGPARALLYGGPDYLPHANETVLTWAMVESQPALDCVAEIAAVPGLDGIYVGPNDLALSLGETPGWSAPPDAIVSALQRIAAAADAAGKWLGGFCPDPATTRLMRELGFRLLTPGNDAQLLRQAAGRRIAEIRGEAAPGGGHGTGGY